MVKIKGLNQSLVFVFDYDDFSSSIDYLRKKIKASQQLFTGSRVIFKGEALNSFSAEQIMELQRLCLNNGIIINNIEPAPPAAPPAPQQVSQQEEPRDLFIYKNLRSGQKIYSDGAVIIFGDVHESAEIVAAGDVIVLGKLAGLVHAGCYGDTNSIVFALHMSPTQIRIGNRISRSSGEPGARTHPEIAFLEDDVICLKKYNSRENLKR